MVNDLPIEARPHFEEFIKEAAKIDFDKQEKITSSVPLKNPQVLHMRAFKRFDNVCIHARIYVKGTYGILGK